VLRTAVHLGVDVELFEPCPQLPDDTLQVVVARG
jgi:hypothetical protein